MIFEMRTYLMKPGSIPKVEELFGAGMPARTKLSRFGGFWRTEVGTLNQIIHVWPYKDVNERDHIRAEAIRTGVWPPKIADNILEMESKILHPAPFSPHFEPGEHGAIYEFRTYTYGPGAIPKVIEAWTPLIKARSRHLAAGLRGLHRHRRAQPVGPCLGLQEHGRPRDAPRPGDEAGRLAAAAARERDPAQAGEQVRRAGELVAAALSF